MMNVSSMNLPASASANRLVDGSGPAAWAGDLAPVAKADWNYARAGHLLERAGFGGTPDEIKRLSRMTPQQAVEELVEYQLKDNSHLPSFEESRIYDPGVMPYTEENGVGAAIRDGRRRGEALGVKTAAGARAPLQPVVDEAYYHLYADRLESRRMALWWANRMLQTNRPLEEKIALFWHDHFAINYDRVGDYRKVLIYLDTLRKNATGNFRDFVLDIAQDPAMLVYLDNGLNVKGRANENFAREVLELFTMGEGRGYTEHDIREAARAFTGWTQDDLKFVIRQELHDTDNKTIFGQTGNFDGVGVVDLIMKQPATARLIAQKLYNYFVAEDLPPQLHERLAQRFRDAKYELKPLLKTIFLSKDFYSPHAYATQIKTPAHLIVSTCKKLGLKEIPGTPEFRATMAALGQELLAPPNVAGWEGGRSWINPATLLERGNYVMKVLFAEPESQEGLLRPSAGGEVDRPRTRTPAGDEAQSQMTMAPANANPNNRYAAEEYNLALGVNRGVAKANQRVKPVPPKKAESSLVAMAQGSGAQTPEQVVDYFALRFLRLPLGEGARHSLVAFARNGLKSEKIDYQSPNAEKVLRELAHLIRLCPTLTTPITKRARRLGFQRTRCASSTTSSASIRN